MSAPTSKMVRQGNLMWGMDAVIGCRVSSRVSRSILHVCRNRFELLSDHVVFLLLNREKVNHELAAALAKGHRRNRPNIPQIGLVATIGGGICPCRLKHRILGAV